MKYDIYGDFDVWYLGQFRDRVESLAAAPGGMSYSIFRVSVMSIVPPSALL